MLYQQAFRLGIIMFVISNCGKTEINVENNKTMVHNLSYRKNGLYSFTFLCGASRLLTQNLS